MGRSNLRTRLRRIGTGQGFLVSKAICRLLSLEVGDELVLDIDDDGLVLRAISGEK